MMTESNGPTLSVGNYSITQSAGGFGIFLSNELTEDQWVATAPDPEMAMKIVEGLVMVEMKRFYHPESAPILKGADSKPLPPFIKKGD